MLNKLNMDIFCIDRLGQFKEAHAFALLQHAEMFAANHTDILCITGEEHAVVCCSSEGQKDILGVIVFVHDEITENPIIHLMAVDKNFLRQGVFRAMWKELLEVLTSTGSVDEIFSGVHVDNVVANKAMQAVGMVPQYTTYGMHVSPLFQKATRDVRESPTDGDGQLH